MDVVGKYYENTERIAAYRLFRSVKAREDLRQLVEGANFNRAQSRQIGFNFDAPKSDLEDILPLNVMNAGADLSPQQVASSPHERSDMRGR
jgi:hypothetical protein